MNRKQTALIALVLVAVALALRLPHVGDFLTADERRIWTTLTAEFAAALLRGDWAATATSGYPGVTTTWAGSLGLAGQWVLDRPADVTSLVGMADALLADPARLDMLPWLRLGVSAVSALGLAVVFLLASRLLSVPTALLGAGLLALDPFLVAHTRILNTDPLLAVFAAISWLALLQATRSRRRGYAVLSGAAFGLATLSKSPALLLLPLVVAWIFWQQGHRQKTLGGAVLASLVDLLWFGLPALVTMLLLWPALWSAPLETLRRVWEFSSVLGQTGHELGNFWLGQSVAGPGFGFYPAVLIWRTTPVTLIGVALALVAALTGAGRARSIPSIQDRQAPARSADNDVSMARALWLYVIWFALILSFSPKKFDRYLLPVFPIVDILAAWGYVMAVAWLATFRGRKPQNLPRKVDGSVASTGWMAVMAVLLITVQGWSALSNLPTYLTAYNPLVGGMRTAREVMLVGWGEGLEEAARYLDQQPGAGRLRVASWYGRNVFEPFFRGQSFDLYYDVPTAADLYANDVDYVVTYVNQLQREMLDEGIQQRLNEPAMSAVWHNLPLAQVYRWPKPYNHTALREMAPGLWLLGWNLGQLDQAKLTLPVTLFWDATRGPALPADQPLVAAWLKDEAGEVWSVAEERLDPETTQPSAGWLDQSALAQTLVLELPAGLLAGSYRVEMAPQGFAGLGLGEVAIPAMRAAEVGTLDAEQMPQLALFGDEVQLLGYSIDQEGGELVLELLWAARSAPPMGIKFFVHVTDETENIVAQYDGTLAAPPGQPVAEWQQGDLVRQRVRLPLPAPAEDSIADAVPYRIYVGLYHPDDGRRLPLTMDGAPQLDDRLLLLDGNPVVP